MNITKDTTDEEILAPVELAKIALHAKMGSKPWGATSAEDIATEANYIAKLEGIASVRYEYRNALQYEASEEAQRRMLTQILCREPDDTYSGRLNDNRRAKLEGVRSEVAEILSAMGVRF